MTVVVFTRLRRFEQCDKLKFEVQKTNCPPPNRGAGGFMRSDNKKPEKFLRNGKKAIDICIELV